MRKCLRTRLILLAATAVVAALSAPVSAGAAPYRISPCVTQDATTSGATDKWLFHGQQIWDVDASCQNWTFLRQQWYTLPSEGPAWAEISLGAGHVLSASLHILPGDGPSRHVVEGVAFCGPGGWPTNCGTSFTQQPGDPVNGRDYPVAGADIPANADRMVMHATCTQNPYCDQGTPMKFRDVWVTLDDPTPPTTSLVHGDPLDWHSSTAGLTLIAHDGESSLGYTDFAVGNKTSTLVHCDGFGPGGNAYNCPGDVSADSAIPMSILKQGTNTVTATTYNNAGMASMAAATTKVDTVPPPIPQAISVGANAHGYVRGLDHILSWSSATEREPTATTSGVVSAKIDIEPTLPGQDDPPPFVATGLGVGAYPISFPDYGAWNVTVTQTDAAGNVGLPGVLSVNVDADSAGAPILFNPLPPVTAAQVSTGVTLPWGAAGIQDSPVCGYRVKLDPASGISLGDASDNDDDLNIDVTQPQWTLTPATLASIPDGDTKLHVQTVACSGAVSPTFEKDIIFDRTPPTVSLDPSSGWVTTSFNVKLTGADGGNGAARPLTLYYQLDDAQQQTVHALTANVPMPVGRHVLTFRAVDGVGNSSQTKTIDIGRDSDAPVAAFAQRSPADPAHVEAQVGDAVSGLTDAWIEIGTLDGKNWRRVGPRFQSADGSTNVQVLSADLPDDGTLPDGEYRLRVFAKDVAGNQVYSYVTQSGTEARLSFPLRAHAQFAFGFAGAATAASDAVRIFDFGESATVEGRLTTAAGAPIVNAPLSLVAQADGGGRHLLSSPRTDAEGHFATKVSADVSRTLTIAFAGDAANGSATASTRQLFRAGVTLRASTRSVARGVKVMLRGRVSLLSAAVPARGKRVELEFCARKRCTSLNLATRTRSDGSFVVAFPTSTARPGSTYRIRARVPGESGWPFADGESKIVEFQVKSR